MRNTGFCSAATRIGRLSLLLVALLLAYRTPSSAERTIVVVTHSNSTLTTLSQDEVTALFLGKYKSSHDVLVKPFDNTDSHLRERFYLAIADMSAMRVKAYWSRIVFSGQGRPPKEISPADAATVLANETNALTYLREDQVTDDMKILFKIP
ncbi:MAG: hypothetical protein ACU836_00425 [Gammaproteobacteria bacterium]